MQDMINTVAGVEIQDIKTEERLQTYFELLSRGYRFYLFKLNMKAPFNLMYISPSCYQMLGYRQKEFYADPKLRTSIIISDGINNLNPTYKYIPADVEYVEAQFQRKDGKIIWVELHRKAFYDANGMPDFILGIVIDSSVRKAAELKARETEARYEKLIEMSPDGVSIQKKGIVQFVNRSMVELLGANTPDEIIGRQACDFVHPAFQESMRKKIDDIMKLESQLPPLIESRAVQIGGKIIDIEVSARKIIDNKNEEATLIFVRNITDKKIAEQKIRDSEILFRSTIENSVDMIMHCDKDGNFKYVSRSCVRELSYQVEELMKINGLDIIYSTDREASKEVFCDLLNKPGQSIFQTFRIMNKEGEAVWIEGTFLNLLHDTAVNAIVVNIRNITERRQSEHEKRDLYERIKQHANKLEQLTYVTSHNLRAPLANLLSLTEIIRHAKEENMLEQVVDKMEISVRRLDSTLRDVIHIMSQQQRQEKDWQQMSWDDIYNEATQRLENQIRQSGVIIRTAFKDAPTINFNRAYLINIIQNLVENAVKYRSTKRPATVLVKTETVKKYTRLTVVDNGIGIDLKNYRTKLFGLYQRLHPEIEGKGIGLYLVKSQVESQGGYIEVESEPDVGTAFYVYLTNN
jgi:PAS domain S-box-containing protein